MRKTKNNYKTIYVHFLFVLFFHVFKYNISANIHQVYELMLPFDIWYNSRTHNLDIFTGS